MARDNDSKNIKYNPEKSFLGSIHRNGLGSDAVMGMRVLGNHFIHHPGKVLKSYS